MEGVLQSKNIEKKTIEISAVFTRKSKVLH